MTYEEYWYGDPLMVRAFYKAEQLRQQRISETAWVYGAYTLRALDATVGNALRKEGQKPAEYPDKPIEFYHPKKEEESKEDREEKEKVWAEAYMMNMVMAGKNWKK